MRVELLLIQGAPTGERGGRQTSAPAPWATVLVGDRSQLGVRLPVGASARANVAGFSTARTARPVPTSLLAALTTAPAPAFFADRKSTRLNSSHMSISYAVFCLKKKIKL